MIAWSEVGDLREDAAQDPRVVDALTAWRTCVDAAVGESAATPDELARRYAFSDGDTYEGVASDHEKAVATADATCQQQTDLDTRFRVALADRERAAMGDRVDIYDNWARQLDQLLHIAAEQLAQRRITLPSLDES